MNELERLCAIDELKQAKARYFRAVDTRDVELGRSLMAEDFIGDYRGSCTDPTTGRNFVPDTDSVVRGRDAWSTDALTKANIVSVHQGHNCEITFDSNTLARVIWSMTDRLYMPPGAAFSQMTGYGHYHETYEKIGGAWKLKTLRLTRLRVEIS